MRCFQNHPRLRARLGRAALPTALAAAALGAVAGTSSASDEQVQSALARPAQASPTDGARVEAVPPFAWRPVRRGETYEFQLSADGAFRSTVDRGSFSTRNSFATIDKTLADGRYYWRTRALDAGGRAGPWSKRRSVLKHWSARPTLVEPANGAGVEYPGTPLVLRWRPVPYAYKYRVTVATDPSLAGSVVGTRGRPVETQATALAIPNALAPGTRYYWAVTPLDAAGHPGAGSQVSSFVWQWDSKPRNPDEDDVNAFDEVHDPRFSWSAVPGAAWYEVEVNRSAGYASGSKVCCAERVIGTALTPTELLPDNDGSAANDGYYWRVRALDVNGNPGEWSTGDHFAKQYDTGDPPIKQLRIRDNEGDPLEPANPPLDLDPTTPYLDTSSPILSWAPVPGASKYKVEVTPWVSSLGCNWNASLAERWRVETPSTAWTAKVRSQTSPVPTGPASIAGDVPQLVDERRYCARVVAVGGDTTEDERTLGKPIELGDSTQPAFEYRAPTSPPSPDAVTMAASDYLSPVGSTVPRMPLFRWKAKLGVCGYFVVVATDQAFTNVIDVAKTVEPAYAPRPGTYPDESTAYFWAVLPVQQDPDAPGACAIVPTSPGQNSPRSFHKQSVAPTPLAPANDLTIASQPLLRWTGAEAARNYRVQVSTDPNFKDGRALLDNVVTGATAYTGPSTYPADAKIYWRVQANDEAGVGLNWSPVRSFRRTLGIPAPSAGNPAGGEFLPALSWNPVPGAVSYSLHVDQVDGTRRDFDMRSTAFTPTLFYGTGVWQWQVRANFPGASGRVVPGGYSARRSFTRYIGAPTGARSTSGKTRVLVSWDPSRAARRYRVQFSETNSFARVIDEARVENTSYAPRLTKPGFLDGGPIYWRVAAVDEGNNLGGWSGGRVKLLRRMILRVEGSLVRGRLGSVRVEVKDVRGRALRRARVTPRGAGVRVRAWRTGRRGAVRLRLRPRARGTIRFRVDKRGFRPGIATLRVG